MIPHYRPGFAVKWHKSKKLLESYIERYNTGKRLSEQLRSNHKKLAEYLLHIYRLAIDAENAFGEGIHQNRPLPLLRTNNQQLAAEMGCTDRTIINLRARLKAAGVIKREIFHGTNAQYEIEFSEQVLHLQHKGEPDNAIHHFVPGAAPSQQHKPGTAAPTPKTGMTKSFRHTVTSTGPVTNQLIELSGANFQPEPENQSVVAAQAVGDGGEPVENAPEPVENPQMGIGRVTKPELRTGYETAAPDGQNSPPVAARPPAEDLDPVTPPEFAPDTVAEALAGLSEAAQTTIRRHLLVIWTCINLNLYPDKWISEGETERGQARLAEYFTYAHPDGWPGGAAEIIERVMLVRKWIERGRKEDKKRWVPLPADYFDFRNPTGFRATKKWYKDHMRAKAEIKANELLTKAVKEYLRSHQDGAKYGPSEAYRRIKQRLGKYDQSLLERFHAQIANHASTNSSQAEGQ
ncbi:MAG: hypothetical protein R2824_15720 [Saprospiraceae bacterium]